MTVEARLCRLTETIPKSTISNYSLPENDYASDKGISGGEVYAAVSIQLVQTRRL
jgi:hypothetical protein